MQSKNSLVAISEILFFSLGFLLFGAYFFWRNEWYPDVSIWIFKLFDLPFLLVSVLYIISVRITGDTPLTKHDSIISFLALFFFGSILFLHFSFESLI